MTAKLAFKSPCSENWTDFERLFGERGACGGCWCMWFRLKRADFEKQKGAGNKAAMKSLVHSGVEPGIVAYDGERPIAWCAVAPRSEFPVLRRSHILKPVDDQPVWSIVCFFIDKEFRKMGLSKELLRAALEHAKERGAMIVEGYPIAPAKDEYPDVFAFTGFVSAFKQVGFVEVARRSDTRPIMRYYLVD